MKNAECEDFTMDFPGGPLPANITVRARGPGQKRGRRALPHLFSPESGGPGIRQNVDAFGDLPLAAQSITIAGLDETKQSWCDAAVRQRRLELARKAFREFYAQCFWSYREDAEITEDKIAFVIRGLREHGGLAGYQVAAACPYAALRRPMSLSVKYPV
jgi:hypothetical protein